MGYKNKEKQKEYQRQWLAKRRNEWLAINGPCKKCGEKENLRVDHIDASLKLSHNVWSWSLERRNEELAKCQVLCYDCHVIKTIENKEHAYGILIASSILTEENVIYARKEFLKGVKFVDIAKDLNVKPDTIRKAVRLGWKHLDPKPIPFNNN